MMPTLIPRNNNTRNLLDRLRKIEGKARNRRKFFSDFENKEFMSWTPVSKDNIKFDNEVIPGSGVLTELIDWCNDNCDGSYVAHRGSLYFESDNDAAMFVMVWK
jgi:hypothetical protein